MFFSIVLVVLTFLSMEGIAWLSHKYIMHGFLWNLHEDHHKKEHDHFLERNDFFFLIFAIPAIILMSLGTFGQVPYVLFIGIGITIYGGAYFFIHDLFIHQRIKVLKQTKNKYLLALRRAHKLHHKHIGPENGEYFGMLYIPLKYFKKS